MYFRLYYLVLAIFVALTLGHVNAATGERRERNAREFTGGTGWGSSKEEILQNRQRRKRQLQDMVNAMRKKLADHSSGEITLEPQEKADTERRLDLFSRKLDMMKVDLEEQDIERIVARSESQKKRRETTPQDIVREASLAMEDEL